MTLLSQILPPVRVIPPGAQSIDNWHVVDAADQSVCIVYHHNRAVAMARAILISHLLGDTMAIADQLNDLARELVHPVSAEQRLKIRACLLAFLAALESDR